MTQIRMYSDSSSAPPKHHRPQSSPGTTLFSLFLEYIKAALLTISELQIHLCWTLGHVLIGNSRANKEIRIASRLPGHSYPSQTFLKLKIKRRISGKWGSLVKKSSSGTAFINHYPPTTTPSTIFKKTPMEVLGRVSQMLSGRGYTGEYHARMRIPEYPQWLCWTLAGDPFLNSRLHIPQECPRYKSDRIALIQDIPGLLNARWQVVSLGEPKRAFPGLGTVSEEIQSIHQSCSPI